MPSDTEHCIIRDVGAQPSLGPVRNRWGEAISGVSTAIKKPSCSRSINREPREKPPAVYQNYDPVVSHSDQPRAAAGKQSAVYHP